MHTMSSSSSIGSKERSLSEQLNSLTAHELQAFQDLKSYWLSVQDKEGIEYNDFMILRFVRNSPGKEKFNVAASKKVAHRYATWAKKSGVQAVNISTIRAKLETGNFIVTGGTNLAGNATLYFQASKHFPASADMLIHSLTYTLSAMSEASEATCTNGVSFLLDMEGWGWSNFSANMSKSMAETVQGRFPCRLRQCVIYNAPRIFGIVWKMVGSALSTELQEKIVYVNSKGGLTKYFSPDNLPLSMGGTLDLDAQMHKWIQERYVVEGLNYEDPYPSEEEAAAIIHQCAARQE